MSWAHWPTLNTRHCHLQHDDGSVPSTLKPSEFCCDVSSGIVLLLVLDRPNIATGCYTLGVCNRWQGRRGQASFHTMLWTHLSRTTGNGNWTISMAIDTDRCLDSVIGAYSLYVFVGDLSPGPMCRRRSHPYRRAHHRRCQDSEQQECYISEPRRRTRQFSGWSPVVFVAAVVVCALPPCD